MKWENTFIMFNSKKRWLNLVTKAILILWNAFQMFVTTKEANVLWFNRSALKLYCSTTAKQSKLLQTKLHVCNTLEIKIGKLISKQHLLSYNKFKLFNKCLSSKFNFPSHSQRCQSFGIDLAIEKSPSYIYSTPRFSWLPDEEFLQVLSWKCVPIYQKLLYLQYDN